MRSIQALGLSAAVLVSAGLPAAASSRSTAFDGRIAHYAKLHGVPESLVHRVILRESRYQHRAVSRGNYGLMQIRHATARGMGYRGGAAGLLDPETNLAYGVPYLANAWRLANGSEARAISLYASGYYYVAKKRGLLASLQRARFAPADAEITASIPVRAQVDRPARIVAGPTERE